MSRARKFLVGERFASPTDAVLAIAAGEWVMFNNKPMHPSWAGGWPINCIKGFVWSGRLRRAIPNPEYKPKEPKK